MKKILVVPAIPYVNWDSVNHSPINIYYNEMEREELLKVVDALKSKYSETEIVIDGSDWYGTYWQVPSVSDYYGDSPRKWTDEDELIWDNQIDMYADDILVVAYSDLLKDLHMQPKETMCIEDLLEEPRLDLDKVLEGNTGE